MRSLYPDFYDCSMAQLRPLKTGFIKLNGKNLGYITAFAEAESASEREAALALKRDVASSYWACGRDGFFKNPSEMM